MSVPRSGNERGLGEPIRAEHQDPRIQELDANRRRHADEIRRIARSFTDPHGVMEDGIYRFYHQSIKVSTLYGAASQARDLFGRLCPSGCQINPWFTEIAEDASRAWAVASDLRALNAAWTRHARPAVEFAFHCEYFLTQLVRYETEAFAPMTVLPSGVAAILHLYGVR